MIVGLGNQCDDPHSYDLQSELRTVVGAIAARRAAQDELVRQSVEDLEGVKLSLHTYHESYVLHPNYPAAPSRAISPGFGCIPAISGPPNS